MGDPAFGASPKGDFTFPFFVSGIEQKKYGLRVYSSDGELQGIISQFADATLEFRLNEPEELKFSVSLQDASESGLFGRNEVWVFDQDQLIVSQCIIAVREIVNDASGKSVSVTAFGYLSQWSDEQAFNVTEEEISIEQIVTNLLADQDQIPALTFGTIDSGVGSIIRKYEAKNPITFLALIKKLEASLPTETIFFVDSARRFNWFNSSTIFNQGTQLRTGSNLQNIMKELDWSDQADTVVAFNGQYGDEQLTSTQSSAFAGYRFRKMITIDRSEFEGSGAAGGFELEFIDTIPHLSNAAANGSDIIFVDSDLTTVLSHVLNSFTQATGSIDADVTFANAMSGVQSNVFYIFYGLV